MISRRIFLSAVGGSLAAASLSAWARPPGDRRRKMAIITTEWRYGSHAWHMGERFLAGYPLGGKWRRPELDVVSAYVDQKPTGDLSQKRAEEFGFP